MLKVKNSFNHLDAAKFKTAFNDAKEFNRAVKTGGELKYAPVLEEREEEGEKKTEIKSEKTETTTEKKQEQK